MSSVSLPQAINCEKPYSQRYGLTVLCMLSQSSGYNNRHYNRFTPSDV